MDMHLGIGGVALGLTIALWFGTTKGGKHSLTWGWTLFLATVAGCAYKAAGEPFSWISDLIMDGAGMAGGVIPKVTAAGLCMALVLIVLFAKNSLRKVAFLGIAFTTVAAGADAGPFHFLAQRIEIIAMHWA
ncbi:hypothetical protein [Streptomyces sp. SAI-127]|uniref:hypothetical protein n=1 Tax=Streptomyces sp. SAI-127 TaxID=2940543 RepID=UPI0024761B98|nr:hypothetical protein [Streptomyces sp. SAI-127]MDH6489618.1 hypothetical protein [Streptomyces sp. SAI-127]